MHFFLLFCWFGVGVLAYGFIEYAHHRWGGHTRWLVALRASHLAHHRDPQEGGVTFREKIAERAPLVGKVLAGFAVVCLVLFSVPVAGAILAGMLGGYLHSEWFHHRMHHRWPGNAVGRFLWRHHYVHHFVDGTVNYGFTSPIWDLLLGTYRHVNEVQVPTRLVPPMTEAVDGIEPRSRVKA